MSRLKIKLVISKNRRRDYSSSETFNRCYSVVKCGNLTWKILRHEANTGA